VSERVCRTVSQLASPVRGVTGVSTEGGEVKFVFLKLAFQSTLGRQVCNFVFVPEKTG